MFLTLTHNKLDVYVLTKKLVVSCYELSKTLPDWERFNMTQQIRRAALSIQLNIAEGSSRKSQLERSRYYEIARGSVIEIDSILDAGEALNYWQKENLELLGDQLTRVFMMLSKIISNNKN